MFKKFAGKSMKQKLNFGYSVVIGLMVISGILNIIGIAFLFGNMNSYINGAQRADTAVKICRIDINIAARSVREMALNEDESAYAGYQTEVEERMNEVGTELDVLKETGLIEDELYNRYVQKITDWGTVAYEIIGKIEAGDRKEATRMLLEVCTPTLEELVDLSKELDATTEELKTQAIQSNWVVFLACIIVILIFVIVAAVSAVIIGKKIILSITTPLAEIETVAQELSAGNLHSNLEYHSSDEIGALAHSLRKSIRILGSYVDDISRAMNEFSNGNFDVQPDVEWKGDFTGILEAFMKFERSMADTVKGIQRVADQVKSGAEQVSESATDLAQGATDQAAITEELAATIENISAQVSQNAESAKEISKSWCGCGDPAWQ